MSTGSDRGAEGNDRARPYRIRPIEVIEDRRGRPIQVAGSRVVSIREEWLIEEGWWWGLDPIRRRYFELVTIEGRDVTVFKSLPAATWFSQRA